MIVVDGSEVSIIIGTFSQTHIIKKKPFIFSTVRTYLPSVVKCKLADT